MEASDRGRPTTHSEEKHPGTRKETGTVPKLNPMGGHIRTRQHSEKL